MTDLISEFNVLLKKYPGSPTTSHPRTLPRIDHFIDDACKINARIDEVKTFLRDVRQSYLAQDFPLRRAHSTIKRRDSKYLTVREKEEIDARVKQILRELDANIRILAEAEDIRRHTEFTLIRKKYEQWGMGALGAWAAGGMTGQKSSEQEVEEAKTNTISTHRENVLYFLRQRLQKWASQQASMMEKRISRELENNRSLTVQAYSEQMKNLGTKPNVSSIDKSDILSIESAKEQEPAPISGLSPEQIQIFEQDNQDMLQHYETTLNQVRTAEKSLVEISELQNQLVHNLASQSAHIEQLIADSHLTTDNVGSGNKQLKEATERKSTAKLVFYTSCGLSIFLIVWDFLI